ncbi:MAG: phenylacetic acid degradation protein, partial [Chitinophagia bacterium]|nr:phenylacetic acid degradation protein [Chitinophagia bacterium]
MSLHFHSLALKEVRQETADCVSLLFTVPETLQSTYQFLPGQNLTLKTMVGGQEVRRSYSICSAPHEKELRVAIKKVEGGVFSGYANEKLKAGDTLEVMPPTGKFNTPLHASQSKNYLMIAAGSGITPILSLVKSILYTEPASTVTMLYGNRSRSSIIFFEELEQLKNRYIERFNLIHVLSREKTDSPLQMGRIDEEKLATLQRL